MPRSVASWNKHPRQHTDLLQATGFHTKPPDSWPPPFASTFDGHSPPFSATTSQTSVFARHMPASPSSSSNRTRVYSTVLGRQPECARRARRTWSHDCPRSSTGRPSPGRHRTVPESNQGDVRDRQILKVAMEQTRTAATSTFARPKSLLAASLRPSTGPCRRDRRLSTTTSTQPCRRVLDPIRRLLLQPQPPLSMATACSGPSARTLK